MSEYFLILINMNQLIDVKNQSIILLIHYSDVVKMTIMNLY